MIKTMKKFAGDVVFWATYPYWVIRTGCYGMTEYKAIHGRSILDLTKEERRAFLESSEFTEVVMNKSGARQFLDWLHRWAS